MFLCHQKTLVDFHTVHLVEVLSRCRGLGGAGIGRVLSPPTVMSMPRPYHSLSSKSCLSYKMGVLLIYEAHIVMVRFLFENQILSYWE